jgi:hypothetical protein
LVNPLFDPLALQATEERFSHRVIPAFTPTTHAGATQLDRLGLELGGIFGSFHLHGSSSVLTSLFVY